MFDLFFLNLIMGFFGTSSVVFRSGSTGKPKIYARAAKPYIFGTCPGMFLLTSASLFVLMKPYILSYIYSIFYMFYVSTAGRKRRNVTEKA